jgi:hypothetical protein
METWRGAAFRRAVPGGKPYTARAGRGLTGIEQLMPSFCAFWHVTPDAVRAMPHADWQRMAAYALVERQHEQAWRDLLVRHQWQQAAFVGWQVQQIVGGAFGAKQLPTFADWLRTLGMTDAQLDAARESGTQPGEPDWRELRRMQREGQEID